MPRGPSDPRSGTMPRRRRASRGGRGRRATTPSCSRQNRRAGPVDARSVVLQQGLEVDGFAAGRRVPGRHRVEVLEHLLHVVARLTPRSSSRAAFKEVVPVRPSPAPTTRAAWPQLRPSMARNSSVVFVTGKGSSGSGMPSMAHSGPQPSAGCHSTSRSAGRRRARRRCAVVRGDERVAVRVDGREASADHVRADLRCVAELRSARRRLVASPRRSCGRRFGTRPPRTRGSRAARSRPGRPRRARARTTRPASRRWRRSRRTPRPSPASRRWRRRPTRRRLGAVSTSTMW